MPTEPQPADLVTTPAPRPARRRRDRPHHPEPARPSGRRAAGVAVLDRPASGHQDPDPTPRSTGPAGLHVPYARPEQGPAELTRRSRRAERAERAEQVEQVADEAPRRRPAASAGRRDLRLAGQATKIIERDRRRRWFAAATVLVVLATIVIPSMIMNGAARAAQQTSGTMQLKPGGSAVADSGVAVTNGTGSTVFALPSRPAGGSLYLAVELRNAGSTGYRAKARVYPTGEVVVGLSRVVGGNETALGSRLAAVTVPAGGGALHLEGRVARSGPARLAVRAWTGEKAPGWQLTGSDATTSIATGTVRAWSYLSAGATSGLALGFSGLTGLDASDLALPPTVPTTAPTAAPTLTPTSSPTGTSTTITSKPAPSTSTSAPTASTGPTGGSGGGSTGSSGVGVPAGTKLTVHTGDLNITKDGAVYSGLDIRGFVDVHAQNVTIKNSIIRGGVATSNRAVVNVTDPAVRDFVLTDSEVQPSNPSVRLDGVNGGNFTLRRVEIQGGVDQSKIFRDDARIVDSWLHGAQTYAADPNQGGGASHNDGVQVQGGSNVSITGTRIEGARNSAIMVTQDFAATRNLTISGNQLSGGACTVNVAKGSIGPITITGNAFGRDSTVKDCAVAATPQTLLSAAKNIWAGTADPAKINIW